MTPAGFPHSDIPGSKLVCSSPRLIAAYRVLHRLLVPRHPPCALSSLTGNTKVLHLWLTQRLVFSCQRAFASRFSVACDAREYEFERIAISLYGPPRIAASLSRVLVEIAGLEPAASGLQSRRSPI